MTRKKLSKKARDWSRKDATGLSRSLIRTKNDTELPAIPSKQIIPAITPLITNCSKRQCWKNLCRAEEFVIFTVKFSVALKRISALMVVVAFIFAGERGYVLFQCVQHSISSAIFSVKVTL